MSSPGRLVIVGRVGRAHGRDGSFWVEGALAGRDDGGGRDPLAAGAEVVVAGRAGTVERRAGTDGRPLVSLSCVADREAAAALRGEPLLVAEEQAPLAPGEWLAEDLVGACVGGIGEVRRVLAGPSCDLLEVGDRGVLVPLVSDAIRRVDLDAGRIEVDHGFLSAGTGEDADEGVAGLGSDSPAEGEPPGRSPESRP